MTDETTSSGAGVTVVDKSTIKRMLTAKGVELTVTNTGQLFIRIDHNFEYRSPLGDPKNLITEFGNLEDDHFGQPHHGHKDE